MNISNECNSHEPNSIRQRSPHSLRRADNATIINSISIHRLQLKTDGDLLLETEDMKTILIMRHAKSDWQSKSESDHDRPLNHRGRLASRSMGSFLSTLRQVPQNVLVSSATRARSTVDLAVGAGAWRCPIVITPELYSQSPDRILNIIQGQNNSIDSLMLAGHEPTSSSMLSDFVGGGSFPFPTAAIARIDFPIDVWTRIDFGLGQLKWFVTPKIVQRGQMCERSSV